jgi:hypothetical protein
MAKPTEAQQKALDVLKRFGTVRISNETADDGRVYWQTARWLKARGYAAEAGWDEGELLELTDAGRAA